MKIKTSEEITKILDSSVWSFSRINSFNNCKLNWYLTYIEKIRGDNNFFGLYGTFAHSIFEKYNKGEMELDDLYDYADKNYESFVNLPAPPNRYVDIYKSYKDKLLTYLAYYSGNQEKVIAVEKNVKFDLQLPSRVIKFTGFIDLLLEDENGDYIILDYKSKSAFKNKQEEDHYLHQLYLYAIGVYKEYGKYPKLLKFEMFKIGKTVTEEFNESKIQNTLEWADDIINRIYEETEYIWKEDLTENDYFCKNLCGYYKLCGDIQLGLDEELEVGDGH